MVHGILQVESQVAAQRPAEPDPRIRTGVRWMVEVVDKEDWFGGLSMVVAGYSG